MGKWPCLMKLRVGKVYAETLGISNLPEEVLTTLSQDLEYRMREVIQVETERMARHLQRRRTRPNTCCIRTDRKCRWRM